MSVEAFSRALHHSSAIGSAKLVMLGIAWHTGENQADGCYPSQDTLAKYANVSPRQVRRCIAELVEMDELHVITNGGERYGSSASTNHYTMLIDCPEDCDGSLQHKMKRTSKAGEADI